ncbi:retrovirus-related Pol polyprotein from transposon 17.6 [Nephila pilipes]|uniref:Retrovirus-related Pol polyprotein from transposon 17.6 n=1 Tax=Nephila pilipes TaxID=299642 RepID=A0A8X6TBE7_NEPPI|nr:retrovirus-related Pol polyprotein from transposon 17.6 [Nephila pilipes]
MVNIQTADIMGNYFSTSSRNVRVVAWILRFIRNISNVNNLRDAKNGFWQLPLDEESSYLTTFCTPWGRYRFLVLPFGLNSAPEEFQKAMDEIYEEDEDINPYFDDIALGSSTVEEHCRLLRRTLLKARKTNLNFNELKTQLS